MISTKKNISSLFKPFLKSKNHYKGGKGISSTKKNQKVYKLSSNENPIGASPRAIAAVKNCLHELHLYPDTTDIRLREALVKYYDYQLHKDNFLCAASGSEIIDLIIRGFVNENDEVIVSTPCFVPYQIFSSWAGAKIIDAPLQYDTYEIDVEKILNCISPKTKIIFLTSPNNPTGSYIRKEKLEVLLEKIPSNIVIVFDEVYWNFADASNYTNALPYIEKYNNLIALNSFSKTYGLAALRVGYAYMDIEVANYLRQICKPFLISKLSLEGAIAALEDDDFIERTVNTIKEERIFLTKQFKALEIKFYPTQANFFLITPPIPVDDFVNFLREEGISVRPVENFGAPGKVRISIGNREANKALIKAMKKLKVVAE
jgi:histidinol-phosphate aminotransferase